MHPGALGGALSLPARVPCPAAGLSLGLLREVDAWEGRGELVKPLRSPVPTLLCPI